MRVSGAAGVLFALSLAACGGGGGGASAGPSASGVPVATPGPAGGGTASPGPGSASGAGPGTAAAGTGTPVAAPFTAFAPVVVSPSVIVDAAAAVSEAPKVTRLAGGGAVLVWRHAGALLAQQIDASGQRAGAQQSIAMAASAFSVAGLAGGDWVVGWSASTVPANAASDSTFTVQTKRFSSTGAVLQDTSTIDTAPAQSIDAGLDVRATTDGGYAVAWAGGNSLGTGPRQVLMQRFARDGTALGRPVAVNTGAADQSRPRLVPLGDGSLVATWLQGDGVVGGSGTSYTVSMRRFGADSTPSGLAQQVQASKADRAFNFAATRMAGDRIAMLWSEPASAADASPVQAHWQVVEASGAAMSSVGVLGVAPAIDSLDVAPTESGFAAFVQVVTGTNRGTSAMVVSLMVDGNGVPLGTVPETVVDRLLNSFGPVSGSVTGPSAYGFSVAGGIDGHYVFAYEAGTSNSAELKALGK